jgi:uncharacterized protein YjiS (DUF1127 family)
MRQSTDLDNLATLEGPAPGGVMPRHATLVTLQRGSAGNDASCEDPDSAKEVEAWAEHAPAPNGLADPPTIGVAPSMTSYELPRAARAHRSFTLGEIVVAMIQAVGAIAGRLYARHRQRQMEKTIYNQLQRLDDRTLHDIGLDRCEMRSVAAEWTRKVDRTRMRSPGTSHSLP